MIFASRIALRLGCRATLEVTVFGRRQHLDVTVLRAATRAQYLSQAKVPGVNYVEENAPFFYEVSW